MARYLQLVMYDIMTTWVTSIRIIKINTLMSAMNVSTVGNVRSGTASQMAAMHLDRLLKAYTKKEVYNSQPTT